MKKNQPNKNPSEYALYEGKIVSAQSMAEKCKVEGIDPHNLIFKCPGRNAITKEKCEAELTLCSINESNLKQPYFAHRGNKKNHIANCDCAHDYVTLVLSRTANKALANLNVQLIFDQITTTLGKIEKAIKEASIKEKDNKTLENNDTKSITETEVKYVPINNIIDMYTVLAIAVNRAPQSKTFTGDTAETLLINSKTVDKYKDGEIPLAGIKLVVASGQNMNPNGINEMKEHIDDAFWILKDLSEDENPIYYVLVSHDKAIIKKTMETINPTAKGQRKLLVFGKVERQWQFDNKIVCTIRIKGAKGGQVKVLKEEFDLE